MSNEREKRAPSADDIVSHEKHGPVAKKVRTSTAASPAASFFTKASEKPKSDLRWAVHHDSLLTAKYKATDLAARLQGSHEKPLRIKLAAFDLDHTLIKPSSKYRFSSDEHDWMFTDVKVPRKLRDLYESGHQIVIFSNQAGVKLTDSAKLYSQLKLKIKAVTTSLNIPLLFYAATAHDAFRKPRQGMLLHALEDLAELSTAVVELDFDMSFYVGDAAGRPVSKGVAKDFSASDRKFALNAGLRFHTPEEFFLDLPVSDHDLGGFDPKAFENPSKTDHLFARKDAHEIVLFVGCPAAGKSSYYNTFLQPLGYARINQDTLKTRQKCLEKAAIALAEGRSVCVDNTNASIETRGFWLNMAQKHVTEHGGKLSVRAVHFTASTELCEHNNAVRAFSPRHGEEPRELLPKIAFTSFKGRYEPPSIKEGFASIDTVDFVLTGSPEEHKIWRQYWI